MLITLRHAWDYTFAVRGTFFADRLVAMRFLERRADNT